MKKVIFTSYYKFEKLTSAGFRYDATMSTGNYPYFESLLINKRKFNVGGLSLNYVDRPDKWKGEPGRRAEKALTKGTINLSSVFVPDILQHFIGYGDMNGTTDALIMVFNASYTVIEVFIANGYVNNMIGLYTYVKEGYFTQEFELLRAIAKNVFKG